jgi:hypothetical protein
MAITAPPRPWSGGRFTRWQAGVDATSTFSTTTIASSTTIPDRQHEAEQRQHVEGEAERVMAAQVPTMTPGWRAVTTLARQVARNSAPRTPPAGPPRTVRITFNRLADEELVMMRY